MTVLEIKQKVKELENELDNFNEISKEEKEKLQELIKILLKK